MVEFVLIWPTPQAVHVVAPVLSRLSVTEPAGQAMQTVTELELYKPAAHSVQEVAAGSPSVSVVEPAEQTAHPTVGALLY